MTILKVERSVKRLFKKARCEKVWEQKKKKKKAVDTERKTETEAILKIFGRKTSQDVVQARGR